MTEAEQGSAIAEEKSTFSIFSSQEIQIKSL